MARVLVIDDDKSVAAFIKDVLEGSNIDIPSCELEKLFGAPKDSGESTLRFKVIKRSSGRDGIEALRDSVLSGKRIALAFIDITLPDMNGLEVGHQLGKIDDRLKIVYISGWDLPDLFTGRQKGGPGDSGHFIQKPFMAKDIVQYATTLCGETGREPDNKVRATRSLLNLNLVRYD